MRKILDISNIGWDAFSKKNTGDYLVYSYLDDSIPLYVSRIYIPNKEDPGECFDETKVAWIIEKYPRIDSGDDVRFHGEWIEKEYLILRISKEYPEDLTWLLFHPEWLNQYG